MLCATLALAIMTAPTGAQENTDSANFMLPHCKRFLAVAGTGKTTFVEGVFPGSITAFAFVGHSLDGKYRFCFPKGATHEQMIRVVIAYIEARPGPVRTDDEIREQMPTRSLWGRINASPGFTALGRRISCQTVKLSRSA
jgi:hypothetical protein